MSREITIGERAITIPRLTPRQLQAIQDQGRDVEKMTVAEQRVLVALDCYAALAPAYPDFTPQSLCAAMDQRAVDTIIADVGTQMMLAREMVRAGTLGIDEPVPVPVLQ